MNNCYAIEHPKAGYGMTFEIKDTKGNVVGTLFCTENKTIFNGMLKFECTNMGQVYGEDKTFKMAYYDHETIK